MTNDYVNLENVMEIITRYAGSGRGAVGENLMREIASLHRIQIEELMCSVFMFDEWMHGYVEDAERFAKKEMIRSMLEAIEKSGRVNIEKRREDGRMGVIYRGSLIVGNKKQEVVL